MLTGVRIGEQRKGLRPHPHVVFGIRPRDMKNTDDETLHLKFEAPLSTLESRTQRLAQPEIFHAPHINTHIFKYALLFLKCNLNVMQLKIRCSGGRGKLYGHTKDIFAFVSSRSHIRQING